MNVYHINIKNLLINYLLYIILPYCQKDATSLQLQSFVCVQLQQIIIDSLVFLYNGMKNYIYN